MAICQEFSKDRILKNALYTQKIIIVLIYFSNNGSRTFGQKIKSLLYNSNYHTEIINIRNASN